MKKLIIFSLFTLLLVACSADPIPEDKSDYVGVWQGGNIFLEIKADGNGSYAKIQQDASETVDAPIRQLGDGKIVLKYFLFSKTLELTRAPYQEDGKWKMIIDGVTLEKQTSL